MKLTYIAQCVEEIKQIAIVLGNEIAAQEDLINGITHKVNVATGNIDSLNARLKGNYRLWFVNLTGILKKVAPDRFVIYLILILIVLGLIGAIAGIVTKGWWVLHTVLILQIMYIQNIDNTTVNKISTRFFVAGIFCFPIF
jgi:hypothetical protein